MKVKLNGIALVFALGLALAGCQGGGNGNDEFSSNTAENTTEAPVDTDSEDIADHIHGESPVSEELQSLGCVRASSSQKAQVNAGTDKKDEFLRYCAAQTNGSYWCDQLVRPNPRSVNTFRCTYGSSQPHNLIHPDENTWKYPVEAVKIIQDLTAKGIKVSQIYNWWRPEPYNKNVGGAKGRHPYGTSIDVRFGSNSEADRAFRELCKMRSQKRLRAIGHYGSSSLHIGVGDRLANTWGKSCR
ncbi:hypothetical protein [Bdellovibrio bacteriovorus]|uniref:hypothetical protein n=1 Tax=Bdellovibrio bacteriovorus TaxID=959 RepID=UPI0035A5DE81